MKFILLSPEKTLFDGEVDAVSIPGSKGSFTVWPHHAALITTIEKGNIVCRTGDGKEQTFPIDGGFAEVKDNVVSVCVERIIEKIEE